MQAGLPSMWTAMIALVRGVIRASTSTGSRLSVASISASTGRARAYTTAEIVATNVKPGTMTSSPGPTPRPVKARYRPLVPELRARAYRTPAAAATSSSTCRTLAGNDASSGPYRLR
jgi:hypothetical protein